MITSIRTKNFMGDNLDEDITQKIIYTGENTAGKTKRSKAIYITLLGFVPTPGKTIKIASDILNTLGNGKEMMTSVTCGGESFERWFKRNKKGTVSQKFKRNGKTRSKSNFLIELVKAGDPRVVDLDNFISLSENAKIDALFAIYPPDGDLSTLDSDIEASKAKISHLNEEKTKADNVILALIESKNDIELPAGSLAETQKDIETLTNDVNTAREELKAEEIKQAKEKAVEDEKERERVNKISLELAESTKRAVTEIKENEKSQKALNQKMEDNTEPFKTSQTPITNPPAYKHHTSSSRPVEYPRAFKMDEPEDNPAVSIQKIIDALNNSGCEICAGMMIAKVELKKFK